MMMPAFRTLLGCCLLLLLAALSSAMPQSGEGTRVRTTRQADDDVKPPVRIAGGRNAPFPGVGALGSFSNSLTISDRNNRRPPIVFGRRPHRFTPWFRY